ncbi:hypothetical protein [Serinibacter salmoneus]|uniref:hypothetical protein n=1 Tax=Serinibacter salmoneus TaxID=556530 RepID=UPI001B7FF422|nr:hypothetical protein [Serinibacter salmoneus]
MTAAFLAQRAAAAGRGPCLLVEVDGRADALLGIRGVPGPRWADLPYADGPFRPALAHALPTWRGLGVLGADERGAPGVAQVEAVLTALESGAGTMVVDLPPAGSVLFAHLVPRCDELLVMIGRDALSQACLRGLLAVSAARPGPGTDAHPALGLLVREGAGARGPDALARAAGLPLVGRVPDCRSIRRDVAAGFPPRAGRALQRAITGIAGRLGLLPATGVGAPADPGASW